jgi:hypothetical protein
VNTYLYQRIILVISFIAFSISCNIVFAGTTCIVVSGADHDKNNALAPYSHIFNEGKLQKYGQQNCIVLHSWTTENGVDAFLDEYLKDKPDEQIYIYQGAHGIKSLAGSATPTIDLAMSINGARCNAKDESWEDIGDVLNKYASNNKIASTIFSCMSGDLMQSKIQKDQEESTLSDNDSFIDNLCLYTSSTFGKVSTANDSTQMLDPTLIKAGMTMNDLFKNQNDGLWSSAAWSTSGLDNTANIAQTKKSSEEFFNFLDQNKTPCSNDYYADVISVCAAIKIDDSNHRGIYNSLTLGRLKINESLKLNHINNLNILKGNLDAKKNGIPLSVISKTSTQDGIYNYHNDFAIIEKCIDFSVNFNKNIKSVDLELSDFIRQNKTEIIKFKKICVETSESSDRFKIYNLLMQEMGEYLFYKQELKDVLFSDVDKDDDENLIYDFHLINMINGEQSNCERPTESDRLKVFRSMIGDSNEFAFDNYDKEIKSEYYGVSFSEEMYGNNRTISNDLQTAFTRMSLEVPDSKLHDLDKRRRAACDKFKFEKDLVNLDFDKENVQSILDKLNKKRLGVISFDIQKQLSNEVRLFSDKCAYKKVFSQQDLLILRASCTRKAFENQLKSKMAKYPEFNYQEKDKKELVINDVINDFYDTSHFTVKSIVEDFYKSLEKQEDHKCLMLLAYNAQRKCFIDEYKDGLYYRSGLFLLTKEEIKIRRNDLDTKLETIIYNESKKHLYQTGMKDISSLNSVTLKLCLDEAKTPKMFEACQEDRFFVYDFMNVNGEESSSLHNSSLLTMQQQITLHNEWKRDHKQEIQDELRDSFAKLILIHSIKVYNKDTVIDECLNKGDWTTICFHEEKDKAITKYFDKKIPQEYHRIKDTNKFQLVVKSTHEPRVGDKKILQSAGYKLKITKISSTIDNDEIFSSYIDGIIKGTTDRQTKPKEYIEKVLVSKSIKMNTNILNQTTTNILTKIKFKEQSVAFEEFMLQTKIATLQNKNINYIKIVKDFFVDKKIKISNKQQNELVKYLKK